MNPIPDVVAPKLRPRLTFVDGIRGAAALYVALAHAMAMVVFSGPIPAAIAPLQKSFSYPTFVVCAFIVLSGFCLMLPVVRSQDAKLAGGILGFFRRRVLRILPTYYAVLLFSIALIWFTKDLPNFHEWGTSVTAFGRGNVLAHIFLVHNLNYDWFGKIDPPMWSIAVEWQIYFLFPVIIWIWRRLGIGACVLSGLLLGELPHFVMHGRFDYSRPHYVALFAFGMAAASICFRSDKTNQLLRDSVPWAWLIYLPFLALAVANHFAKGWVLSHSTTSDLMVGVGVTCLLIRLGTQSQVSAPSKRSNRLSSRLWTRLLETRPLVAVGQFSHSLYLVHVPTLTVFNHFINQSNMNSDSKFCLMICGGVPFAVLISYLFYLAFERPFLSARKKPTAERLDSVRGCDGECSLLVERRAVVCLPA